MGAAHSTQSACALEYTQSACVYMSVLPVPCRKLLYEFPVISSGRLDAGIFILRIPTRIVRLLSAPCTSTPSTTEKGNFYVTMRSARSASTIFTSRFNLLAHCTSETYNIPNAREPATFAGYHWGARIRPCTEWIPV